MKYLIATIICATTVLAVAGKLTPEEFQELNDKAAYWEEMGEYADAADAYEDLGKAVSGDQDAAANYYFHRANCLYFAGKTYKADKAYRELVKKYKLQVPLDIVFERMRQLANNYDEGKGTFLGLSDPLSAISIMRFIIDNTPSMHASLSDRYILAHRLIKDKNENEAVAEYQKIIKELPQEAEARYELALLLQKLSMISDGDGRIGKTAARQAKTYLELNTGDECKNEEMRVLLKQVQESQAERTLLLANYYLSERHLQKEAARRYLHDIIRDYPDTQAAMQAKTLLTTNFPSEE